MADAPLHWYAQSERALPDRFDWLSPQEALRAEGMRFAKRRNEYLLRRFTAKRAVARRLGLADDPAALAQIEIENAEDGAPELSVAGRPASLGISLTDRAGWSVCALAKAELPLGCDLELVEPRSEAFVRDYLSAAEQAQVMRSEPGEPRHALANLIWSAKESALKATRTGLRRDTLTVEVTLEAGESSGWWPLVATLAEGGRFPGWWTRFGPFLVSLVTGRETPPPKPLHEPAALTAAAPSHTWLEQPLAPFPSDRR